MGFKHYLLSFLMIFSLTGSLYAADTGGKIGMKSGKPDKAATSPGGKAPSPAEGKGGGGKHDGNKDGNKHGDRRGHRHKPPFFPNPFFPVYGYYGYYYPNDYSYSDPEHPLGYGTTLGTTLSRESNIDANRDLAKPGRPDNVRTYEDVEVYTDYPPGAYGAYGPSGQAAESRTIYIWTDENGVDNYVNDPGLVPAAERENVRIIFGD